MHGTGRGRWFSVSGDFGTKSFVFCYVGVRIPTGGGVVLRWMGGAALQAQRSFHIEWCRRAVCMVVQTQSGAREPSRRFRE